MSHGKNHLSIKPFGLSVFLLLFAAGGAGVSAEDVLAPLPGNDVRLSGVFEERIERSLAHWNKGVVPYAGFVEKYRKGREFFAQGEMWGKAVRSGCQFYRYNQDPELKRILSATVADLLSTRRANGSISCSEVSRQPDGPGGDLWERKYVLLGLDGYYELVERDPAVLKAMIDEVDCTIAQIGPPPKTPIINQGWSVTGIESSTILEPVMRLYRLTGEKRFLDFARYIVSEGGARGANVFEQALAGKDPEQIGRPYPKAYEMMSLFEGLVEYYRATGEERWKQAALNLFNGIRTQEITLVGNGGGDQPFHPDFAGEAWDYTAREQTNPDISRMMETCAGVTWLKFCYQVLCLTGNPAAADEIERYAYNGLPGAMKPEGDGFSYVNRLNGLKTDIRGWGGMVNGVNCTCCNLNGPMGLAYLPQVAVMKSADGPVINLYSPAVVNAPTPSLHSVQLAVATEYPRRGGIVITVNPQVQERFSIRVRIPAWSAKTRLHVNGRAVETAPGTYAVLDRTWSPGDRITMKLDMRCRLIPAPRGSNRAGDHFQAVVRGPIVLARDENRDPGFNEPVTLVARNGIIDGRLITAPKADAIVAVRVPVVGGAIQMVDYASVNSWSGKQVCTWLPMPGKENWIWFPETGNPAENAPVATRWFRRAFKLPAGRRVAHAVVRLTADDRFALYVNGQRMGEEANWKQAYSIDVTAALKAGENVLAVEAANMPFNGPNSAGLIAALTIEYCDGSRKVVVSDGNWLVSDQAAAGWTVTGAVKGNWKKARILGWNGMKPWNYTPVAVE